MFECQNQDHDGSAIPQMTPTYPIYERIRDANKIMHAMHLYVVTSIEHDWGKKSRPTHRT